jgi:hypothetical protein
MCMQTFVEKGIKVEVFTYDPSLMLPDWITRADAAEIWPTSNVMTYQSGFGTGSPSLHSNLFRYALLHKYGGWWIDLDFVLLHSTLPQSTFFFVDCGDNDQVFSGVLKFPRGHPLLDEAVKRCVEIGENAYWGQTGAELLTYLLVKYDLIHWKQCKELAIPIQWFDLPDLFDPGKLEDVKRRCAASCYVHLFNEAWRGSGIPGYLGPPVGSFLHELFASAGMTTAGFVAYMSFEHVKRWIVNRNKSIQLGFEVTGLQRNIRCLEDKSRSKTVELQAEISRLQRDMSYLEDAKGRQQNQIDGLELECKQLKKSLAEIFHSTSWRLTRPLRTFGKVLKKRRV